MHAREERDIMVHDYNNSMKYDDVKKQLQNIVIAGHKLHSFAGYSGIYCKVASGEEII